MRSRAVQSWRRLRHRVRRLGQVDPRDHALLVEATLRLLVARIAIATMPFPRVARRMGGFIPPAAARAKANAAPPSAADLVVARKIGWAVTRAARHIPFEAVCLPQAMAGHAMLRRRGIFGIIHFGTKRGTAVTLDAHAWLDAGEVEVTGYPFGDDFTEIACIA